eukprot:XP_001609467.1 hypothetical protein [Babesia bovis T2Bo]
MDKKQEEDINQSKAPLSLGERLLNKSSKKTDDGAFPGLQTGALDNPTARDTFTTDNTAKGKWQPTDVLLDTELMGENFLIPGMKGTYPMGYRNFIGRGVSETPPPPPTTPPPVQGAPKAQTTTSKWRKDLRKTSSMQSASTQMPNDTSMRYDPTAEPTSKASTRFFNTAHMDNLIERPPGILDTEPTQKDIGTRLKGNSDKHVHSPAIRPKTPKSSDKHTSQVTERKSKRTPITPSKDMDHRDIKSNELPVTPIPFIPSEPLATTKYKQGRTQRPQIDKSPKPTSLKAKFNRSVTNASISDKSDADDNINNLATRMNALKVDADIMELKQENLQDDTKKYKPRRKTFNTRANNPN